MDSDIQFLYGSEGLSKGRKESLGTNLTHIYMPCIRLVGCFISAPVGWSRTLFTKARRPVETMRRDVYD